MNRSAIATLGIGLGLGMLAQTALAQTTSETPADFSPARPATMQDPGIAAPSAGASVYAAPAAAEPAATEAAPAVIEEETAPAAPVVEPPVAVEEADAYATTRRAAPDRRPAHERGDPNPQSGQELGRGLFNNWGPNDFGA